MTWSTSLSVNFSSLLVRMLAASAKPNSEWSVKTVRSPMVPGVQDGLVAEAAQAGVAVHDVDALADDELRKMGKKEKTVGNVAER